MSAASRTLFSITDADCEHLLQQGAIRVVEQGAFAGMVALRRGALQGVHKNTELPAGVLRADVRMPKLSGDHGTAEKTTQACFVFGPPRAKTKYTLSVEDVKDVLKQVEHLAIGVNADSSRPIMPQPSAQHDRPPEGAVSASSASGHGLISQRARPRQPFGPASSNASAQPPPLNTTAVISHSHYSIAATSSSMLPNLQHVDAQFAPLSLDDQETEYWLCESVEVRWQKVYAIKHGVGLHVVNEDSERPVVMTRLRYLKVYFTWFGSQVLRLSELQDCDYDNPTADEISIALNAVEAEHRPVLDLLLDYVFNKDRKAGDSLGPYANNTKISGVLKRHFDHRAAAWLTEEVRTAMDRDDAFTTCLLRREMDGVHREAAWLYTGGGWAGMHAEDMFIHFSNIFLRMELHLPQHLSPLDTLAVKLAIGRLDHKRWWFAGPGMGPLELSKALAETLGHEVINSDAIRNGTAAAALCDALLVQRAYLLNPEAAVGLGLVCVDQRPGHLLMCDSPHMVTGSTSGSIAWNVARAESLEAYVRMEQQVAAAAAEGMGLWKHLEVERVSAISAAVFALHKSRKQPFTAQHPDAVWDSVRSAAKAVVELEIARPEVVDAKTPLLSEWKPIKILITTQSMCNTCRRPMTLVCFMLDVNNGPFYCGICAGQLKDRDNKRAKLEWYRMPLAGFTDLEDLKYGA